MKKRARKMIIKNAKITIEAYKEGSNGRANVPHPTWHVDKMKIERRQ